MTSATGAASDVMTLDELIETARDLQAVAATLATLAADIGRQASEATRLARYSTDEAAQTMQLTSHLVESAQLIEAQIHDQQKLIDRSRAAAREGAIAIDTLAASATSIGSVSTMINGIAGQSRMLALNARIEAARAGPAGVGFAIVANAVRELSAQTSTATHDIDRKAGTLHREMSEVAKLFDENVAHADGACEIVERVIATALDQRIAANTARDHSALAVAHAEQATALVGRLATAAHSAGLIADHMRLSAVALAERTETLRSGMPIAA